MNDAERPALPVERVVRVVERVEHVARDQRGEMRGQTNLRSRALAEQAEDIEPIDELHRALAFDPLYSAAWKQLGRACLAAQKPVEAAAAWRQGIAAASQRGDRQAEKEMAVFLRRLERAGLHAPEGSTGSAPGRGP